MYQMLYPEECEKHMEAELEEAEERRRMEVSMVSLARLESNAIQLCEGRFYSAERYLAFCILFHATAKLCSSWWPMHWDMAHTQSYLRVASTACPVTAADVHRVLRRADGGTLPSTLVHDGSIQNNAWGNQPAYLSRFG